MLPINSDCQDGAGSPLSLFAAVLTVVALNLAPYQWVFYASSALGISFGLLIILSRTPSDFIFKQFVFFASLFATVVIWGIFPAGATAAILFFLARCLANRIGFLSEAPIRLFALEFFAGLVGFLLASEAGRRLNLGHAVPAVLGMLLLARGFSARIKRGASAFVGEAVSAGVASALAGMDAVNFVFLKSPVNSMAIAAIMGYVLYGAGVLGKWASWMFFFGGSLIFACTGQDGFVYFVLFTIIIKASERIWPGESVDSLFDFSTFLFAALSIYSLGRENAFPSLVAISGVLSACVFYAWSGMTTGDIKGFRGIFYGLVGAGLAALSAWVSSFLPYSGVPFAISGGLTALAAPFAGTILENPARDDKWLVATAGGMFAVLVFKLSLL